MISDSTHHWWSHVCGTADPDITTAKQRMLRAKMVRRWLRQGVRVAPYKPPEVLTWTEDDDRVAQLLEKFWGSADDEA